MRDGVGVKSNDCDTENGDSDVGVRTDVEEGTKAEDENGSDAEIGADIVEEGTKAGDEEEDDEHNSSRDSTGSDAADAADERVVIVVVVVVADTTGGAFSLRCLEGTNKVAERLSLRFRLTFSFAGLHGSVLGYVD